MNLTTLIGMTAAICTTVAFVPQAIKTIKSKHTKDLSRGMYTVLSIGVLLWTIYGILIRDLPVILANVVTLIFTSIILILIFKYE